MHSAIAVRILEKQPLQMVRADCSLQPQFAIVDSEVFLLESR